MNFIYGNLVNKIYKFKQCSLTMNVKKLEDIVLDRLIAAARRKVLETGNPPLGKAEMAVLRGTLQGKTYEKIAEDEASYTLTYLKQLVGPQLWKHLSEVFSTKVNKNNIQILLTQQLQQSSESSPLPVRDPSMASPFDFSSFQGESQVPDLPLFYGRADELKVLEQWVVQEKCHLVLLTGLVGMGKSALASQLAKQIQSQFEFILWHSLKSKPLLSDLLDNILQPFSPQDRDGNLQQRIAKAIEFFSQHRCLLILDGMEAILQPGQLVGYYRSGYENYGEFLWQMAESLHQSCTMVTSLEPPREITLLWDRYPSVRLFKLKGLDRSQGSEIFRQYQLGNPESWSTLIERYLGNPVALKIVAQMIRDLFGGNITEFLAQQTFVFEEVSYLLDLSFNRLCESEKEVLYWLAIEEKPISFSTLSQTIPHTLSPRELLSILKSLEQRSLIETITQVDKSSFVLPPLLKEHLTYQLLKSFSHVLGGGESSLSISQVLELGVAEKTPYIDLSQWFKNPFEANWQTIEDFFRAKPAQLMPRLRSAFNLRGEQYAKRFKSIQLGTHANAPVVALLVAIAEAANQEWLVRVQVQPMGDDLELPPQLKVSLLDRGEKIVWEKQLSQPLTFLEFPLLKVKPEEQFSIELKLDRTSRSEKFVVKST